MDRNLRVCVDRVLPVDVMRHQRTVTEHGRTRAILVNGKLWPNGQRLRVRFLGGTPSEQATAREQAQWWTQHANLHFDFGTDPQAEIRVAFDTSDGAWSYVGTDCAHIPLDQPTMNLGFLDGGTAAHEFGHAIGLAHEHQNPDGGIEWNEEVVLRDLQGPPNFWSPDQIRHNVLNKYNADQVRGTRFDGESIMLYFFPGSWVRSGVGTTQNEVLSAVDKEFIGSSLGYPGVRPAPAVLKVNASTRTAAAIGTPGEKDLFTFTVATPGRHVIDTRGSTDVMMKLFGPDSETALVAEDDDGGFGTNAAIRADLVAGTYLAQVQHFDTSGTGAYTIRVRRP